MDAKKAQSYIDGLAKYQAPSKGDLDLAAHLKVDYNSLEEMPGYVQDKIRFAADWIKRELNPKTIDLVMSYVDGYPIDERTSISDFLLLKKIKRAKLSDFDFIVPNINGMQRIEQISPLIKVDMFKYHHKNVKRIRVYGAK